MSVTDLAARSARAAYANALLAGDPRFRAFERACAAYREMRPDLAPNRLREAVARLIDTPIAEADAPRRRTYLFAPWAARLQPRRTSKRKQ
jgi:hypothetical protein